MRILTAILLGVLMIVTLTACGASGSDNTENMTREQTTATKEEHKVLVAYFSASGTTGDVAKQVAKVLQADLYEIVPREAYTKADLDYNDSNSRTTREMKDVSARSQIDGAVEDMAKYDIVFIGYPIWWKEAPRIVSTFVESYDFAGKTIVPFCTSGGNDIGMSGKHLAELTTGAKWLDGRLLHSGETADSIRDWIEQLDILR